MCMMKSIECKLRKYNLMEPLNANDLEFTQRGVIQWVDNLPQIDSMQRSDFYTQECSGKNHKIKDLWEFKFQDWEVNISHQLHDPLTTIIKQC